MADEPLQGHIKPSGHINKQFARWEARERGGWQYLARDRREFITLLGGVVSVFLCVSAAAQEGYYGVGHDKWHQGFYSKLKRNDGQGSCCNLMDCRPTQSRMVGDHYEVKVDGAWTPVPYDKINNVVAPDGGAHVCAPRQVGQNKGVIFCVILPSEGRERDESGCGRLLRRHATSVDVGSRMHALWLQPNRRLGPLSGR